jgi:hypothetical protein
MALYLVSYDIAEKNNDYEPLWGELRKLNAVRILYSEWATPYGGTAFQLADLLRAHVMRGDRILACELFNGPTVAWSNLEISDEQFRTLLAKYA